jgi:hypothetical protein
MDPLSIATSIGGIVSICIRVASGLDALLTKFKNAQVTIMALASQCRAINSGLSQLEDIVNRESHTIRGRTYLTLTFDQTLHGCRSVLSCLSGVVNSLQKVQDESNSQSAIRRRLRRLRGDASVVWNEAEMERFSVLLQGQQSAVSFLIQIMQM